MSPTASTSRFVSCSASLGGLLAGLALLLAVVRLAERPLAHSDLWGHLAFGRYYAEHGGFPPMEPFLQHSVDEPYLPTSWLAQWGGYRLYQTGGTVLLQLVYALLVAGFAGCFLWLYRRISHAWPLAVICCAWLLWLEYQQIQIVRPQLAGMLCYAIMLSLLSGRHSLSAARLGLLFLIMVLWTNLHGSFAIFPVIVMLAACGRGLDITRRNRQRGSSVSEALSKAVRDLSVQRRLLLALGLAAVSLLNPFGWKLWIEVATFSECPNLRDLIEWKPLWRTPRQGTVVLYSLGLTLLTLASVRVPPRWEHWLPVLVLGGLTVQTSRHLVWCAPLLVLAVLPYWNLARLRGPCAAAMRRTLSWLNIRIPVGRLVLLAALVLALCRTPWGKACLQGGPWTPLASYSSRTPIAATQALIERHPQGLIFNTMEWGDWMIWTSNGSLSVFVDTHVPEIPPDVWQDYLFVIRQSPGWQVRWDSYQFSYAMIEYRRHKDLFHSLTDDPAWQEIYRDRRAAVFERVSE